MVGTTGFTLTGPFILGGFLRLLDRAGRWQARRTRHQLVGAWLLTLVLFMPFGR